MEQEYNNNSSDNQIAVKQVRLIRKTASFVGLACVFEMLFAGGISKLITQALYYFNLHHYVKDESQATFWLINIVLSIIVNVIPALLLYFALGCPFRIKDVIRKPTNMKVAKLSVPITQAITIIVSFIVSFVSVLLKSSGVESAVTEYPNPTSGFMLVLYFVYMCVVPAIFEEFMFRGVILTSLRRFGDGYAIVVSSLLFGVMHGNILQFLNTFVIGLLLGYFAVRTGSVLTAIVLHFMNNFVVALLSLGALHMSSSQYVSLVFIFYSIMIVLGIISIIVFKTIDKNAFRVKKVVLKVSKGTLYVSTVTALGMIVAIVFFIYKILSKITFI